jgi:hypothetical protein
LDCGLKGRVQSFRFGIADFGLRIERQNGVCVWCLVFGVLFLFFRIPQSDFRIRKSFDPMPSAPGPMLYEPTPETFHI